MGEAAKKEPMSLMTLAWLAFAGFAVDLVSLLFTENTVLIDSINRTIVIAAWATIAWLLIRYAAKYHKFKLWKKTEAIHPGGAVAAVAIVAALLACQILVDWGMFKPIAEFLNMQQRFCRAGRIAVHPPIRLLCV